MEKILIVEDELIVARDIRKTLERNGYKVSGVTRSVEKALLSIREDRPAFVLIDIFLKGHLTGIDLANMLNKEGIPFIYISANSNQPVLEAAKTTNPFGFIVKPFREKDLIVSLDIARYRYESNQQMNKTLVTGETGQTAQTAIQVESYGAVQEGAEKMEKAGDLRTGMSSGTQVAQKGKASSFEGIIGKSAAMLRVFNLIQQVAPFDTSVLILGESGTGKEGVAHCIFRESGRSTRPFLKVNCGAIPAGLIEAEFFGHEKGAFTGATEKKTGKFETANGGTILLDEIGEMPLEMQAKLLRVLQEKEIQRLGGHAAIKTNVRVIAATSRNLEKEVAEGRFRLDLYYRLNVFPILLPPLRERIGDIPLLVDHFIGYYAGKTGKNIKGIDPGLLEKLIRYPWPGNVRELQHLLERSVLMARGEWVQQVDLPVA